MCYSAHGRPGPHRLPTKKNSSEALIDHNMKCNDRRHGESRSSHHLDPDVGWMGGKSAAGAVFPLIILTLSYLGTWDEAPGPAWTPPILNFSQDFQTNPRLQGSSVYPPRNCLFLLNEQSLAYFVQIAPSSLFDESLAA